MRPSEYSTMRTGCCPFVPPFLMWALAASALSSCGASVGTQDGDNAASTTEHTASTSPPRPDASAGRDGPVVDGAPANGATTTGRENIGNPASIDARANAQTSDTRPGLPTDAEAAPLINGPVPTPFDLDILHKISVTTTSENTLRNTSSDVSCDIVFDGFRLPKSQCHRKGSFGSVSTSKPSLNIKFDGVIDQKLAGLGHIVLNNAKQDPSLLNEHMAYEIYRRAGLAAPLTAHGLVQLNGKTLGLYVIKENIDKDFLARSFGKANKQGNLYKAPLHTDFVDANKMTLKNEKEEKRSRADLIAVAKALRDSPDSAFEANVSKGLNIEQFMSALAIDAIIQHRDGPLFIPNNYYIYDNPADNRFVLVPHGADYLFRTDYFNDALTDPYQPKLDPFTKNKGIFFMDRARKLPALEAKFHSLVGTHIRTAWDPPTLLARIARMENVLRSNTDVSTAVASDMKNFEKKLPGWRDLVGLRRAYVESVTPQ